MNYILDLTVAFQMTTAEPTACTLKIPQDFIGLLLVD